MFELLAGLKRFRPLVPSHGPRRGLERQKGGWLDSHPCRVDEVCEAEFEESTKRKIFVGGRHVWRIRVDSVPTIGAAPDFAGFWKCSEGVFYGSWLILP